MACSWATISVYREIISVRAFDTKRTFVVSRYNKNISKRQSEETNEGLLNTFSMINLQKRQTSGISENNGDIVYYSKASILYTHSDECVVLHISGPFQDLLFPVCLA